MANNASGSSYGITYNSYHTVRSMRLILPDGTLLDTEHQYIEGYLKLAQERGLNMDKKFPYTCMGLPREMVRKRYRDTFGADFVFEGF